MKKINQFYLYIGIIFILSLVTTACASNKEEKKRNEFAQIVENKSAQELLNDLYLGSDGDIQSLARILNATPSSIERLKRGETIPTVKFEQKLREVSIYYFQNKRSYSKLRSLLDDEWKWYNDILYFPIHHPFIFWGINIILLLICAFIYGPIIIVHLCELVVFFLIWGISHIFSPKDMFDKYVDVINPTIERII